MSLDNHEVARKRLLSSEPSDSDGVVALRLADFLTSEPGRRGLYHLSVSSNEQQGPCPLPITHHWKNCSVFVTDDIEAARGWVIQGALAGYCVMRGYRVNGSAYGVGTLAQIRECTKNEMVRKFDFG